MISMNRKLIKIMLVSIAVVAIGGIGGVIAMNPQQPKQSNNTESLTGTPINEPVFQDQSSLGQVESAPVKTETVAEPGESAPTVEPTTAPLLPFDPIEYSHGVLNTRASQGFNVNVSCFDNLMKEANNWTLNKIQIDEVIDRIIQQYPSMCAAYYQYKETDSF